MTRSIVWVKCWNDSSLCRACICMLGYLLILSAGIFAPGISFNWRRSSSRLPSSLKASAFARFAKRLPATLLLPQGRSLSAKDTMRLYYM